MRSENPLEPSSYIGYPSGLNSQIHILEVGSHEGGRFWSVFGVCEMQGAKKVPKGANIITLVADH